VPRAGQSVKYQGFGEQYVDPLWCLARQPVNKTASIYTGKVNVSIYRTVYACMHAHVLHTHARRPVYARDGDRSRGEIP